MNSCTEFVVVTQICVQISIRCLFSKVTILNPQNVEPCMRLSGKIPGYLRKVVGVNCSGIFGFLYKVVSAHPVTDDPLRNSGIYALDCGCWFKSQDCKSSLAHC